MRYIPNTPEGTRDRLFGECQERRRVQSALTHLFRQRGYSEIITPEEEFYDLFTSTGAAIRQEEMELLLDRADADTCELMRRSYSPSTTRSDPFCRLREEKFILQPPNTYQYRQVFQYCTESGFVPDIVLCTAQIKTIKQLVTNEMGVSVLPDFAMWTDRTFSRRPLKPRMDVPVYLYWGSHKQLSKMDHQFLDFMEKYTESAEFKQHFHLE